MPLQTFEITAPNGKMLSITGDHMPTEAEMNDIFAKTGVSTSADKPLAETRMPAGVPARGRGTQLDPEKSQAGLAWATTPLGHPTGVDAVDSFTSPLGIASFAAGGAGIIQKGLSGGVAAAVKAAAGEASPILKYEVARRVIAAPLRALGVPGADEIAAPIAMVIAGYKKGAKPEVPTSIAGKIDEAVAAGTLRRAPEGSAPVQRGASGRPVKSPFAAAAPVDPVVSPAASDPVVQAPPAAAVTRTTAPSPSAESPGSALPDQRALNEEALARRRAEYQARQSAPPAPPLTKAKLVGQEQKEYTRLVTTQGQTHQQAMDLIQAQREFQSRFGLAPPTAEDARFPKGMRGKPPIRP